MAESSYPQPGLKPGDGPDCGAYTANQWRGYNVAKMRSSGMIQSSAPVLPTAAQYPDVGVFYVVPDRLAVTSPGANQISIATGASLVDGTLHYNDTAHTAVAITGPLGNPRIDVVVVRQNYGGVAWPSPNAPALSVPANTARIAIISGAENIAPVAPALIRDTTRATYWDIPLAQYQIAVGGAITNLTDRREWVDAETKRHFVQPTVGRNKTDVADIPTSYSVALSVSGIELIDNKVASFFAHYIVPDDFISSMAVKAVVIPTGTGNIVSDVTIAMGACATLYDTHIEVSGTITEGVANTRNECICLINLSNPALDDILALEYQRSGTNVNDTVNASVWGIGFEVEYLGWGRK